MITSEADCQSAAASIGANYASSAGSEWHSGCLFHGGNAYYSAHEDGSTQNPTDGYICSGGGLTFNTCDDAGMITSEADCQSAAASLGVNYEDAAGSEWHSGCLYHGGNAYYSTHEDGSTQNPTDGYICQAPWANLVASSDTSGTSGCGSDFDANGIVDVEDILIVLSAFGVSADGDANSNGVTDIEDLLHTLANYQEPCTNNLPVVTCEDENDIAVALAYCQNVGAGGGFGAATPEASVYGLCAAEVSDANAVYQVCLVQGVAETAAMICAGLGYATDTCGDVAAVAVASFGSGNGEDVCSIAANNAIAACGLVLELVVEENCEDWAAADGPGLALSSEAIMNLAPSDAVTSIDWCASVNEDDCDNCGQTATEAACNSITDDALVGACEALGPPDAIYTLCIELGFDSDGCWDAVTMFTEDAEVQGALAMYGCAAFPFLQEPFCAVSATLTDEGESCEDWGGFGYVPGSVDTDAFNLAVGTMAQNELAILASVCGNVDVSEACENHDMGHICATIDTEAACGIASDVAVALAYCQSAPACGGDACDAATPEASVYGICMAATADSDALATVCASEGVSTTAHIICSGLGYASDTCDDVAEIAVGAFGSGNGAEECAMVAAGAQAICPMVLDLVAEDTCQEWAEVDGPNIALGTNAILGLQMHMPSGMTAIEYCESVNEEDCDNCGQIATNAACVSPTDEDLLAACDAIGASQTIYTICLDLGFDSDDCNDVVTIFDNTPEITAALDAYGCAALPSIQEGFCAAAAELTDAGMSCADWGGYGYINASVDTDGLNAAIEALESDQLNLLSGACDAVAEMADMGEDEVCANHPLGHICGTIGDLNAAPPPAPVCEDNNALVSATAGMDCPTLVPLVSCEYDTGAGPLSTYCPLTCGVCEVPPPPPPPGPVYGMSYNTCADANIISSADECIAAAASIGVNFASEAGSEWASGCLVHGGNAYYSAHEDGSDQNPTDAYICIGIGMSYNVCTDDSLMISEDECSAAAAWIGVNFASAAGSEWASGCLVHGGNAYYSAHEDGSDQNPTDAYICASPECSTDNNALVSATAGMDCMTAAAAVGCDYDTGAGPLSTHCPLTCGGC